MAMKSKIAPGYDHKRVELYKSLPLDTPFSVFLIASTCCNFKCTYCAHSIKDYLYTKDFNKQNMSWETFTEAVEQLKAFPRRIKSVFLHGYGEPLCNKRLPEMVSYLKQADVTEKIGFVTNGSMLTNETSLALINAGLDLIRISIQGITSEKYSTISGVTLDFTDLVEKIRFFYLNKKQCEVFVKTVNLSLDPGDDDQFYTIFQNISDSMFVGKIVPAFDDIDYSDILDKKLHDTVTDMWGTERKKLQVCPICFYSLGIQPNGRVFPCSCSIEDPVNLGAVYDRTLTEIWNSSERYAFLRMHLAKQRSTHPICAACTAPDFTAIYHDQLDSHAEELLPSFER